MTSVQYYPDTGLVWMRSRSVTTSFKVHARYEINHMLDELGYHRIREWHDRGHVHEARTQRIKIRVVQPAA